MQNARRFVTTAGTEHDLKIEYFVRCYGEGNAQRASEQSDELLKLAR
ncbi:MAG TPA: hypothetical protein VL866_10145 [Pyrinomonadaceae bacterium]|nr:hypothetical protein [Pyrinomonadaceae bacterium]